MSDTDNKTIEMAENLQAAELDEKMAIARRGLDQTKDLRFIGWDGETCFGCDKDIPAARLAMKRVRCVPCQTIAERKGQG